MKLSLRSEYALLTLIQIARANDEALSLESLQDSMGISFDMLTEILVVMKNKRYLRITGREIQLAKPAGRISVVEVIRLFDGALAPLEPVSAKGYGTAPMDREPKLDDLFTQLQNQISNRLERTTIADLL
jgi:Rrf2 family transcriptional regulator, cysteine metabolism repressor